MSNPKMSYTAIEDYAVIGNCHTAALISREGSMDWWCPMRFDYPAVFAALLDVRQGGRFQIRPVQPYRVERRYVDDTNVLETTFQTSHGRLRLTDLMPLGVTDRPGVLQPPHGIMRMIEGVAGEVEIALVYEPRFAYGQVRSHLYDRKRLGFWCTHKGEALTLCSDLPLTVTPDGHRVFGRVVLQCGDRRCAGLSFAQSEPLILRKMLRGRSIQLSIPGLISTCQCRPYRGASEVQLQVLRRRSTCFVPTAQRRGLPPDVSSCSPDDHSPAPEGGRWRRLRCNNAGRYVPHRGFRRLRTCSCVHRHIA